MRAHLLFRKPLGRRGGGKSDSCSFLSSLSHLSPRYYVDCLDTHGEIHSRSHWVGEWGSPKKQMQIWEIARSWYWHGAIEGVRNMIILQTSFQCDPRAHPPPRISINSSLFLRFQNSGQHDQEGQDKKSKIKIQKFKIVPLNCFRIKEQWFGCRLQTWDKRLWESFMIAHLAAEWVTRNPALVFILMAVCGEGARNPSKRQQCSFSFSFGSPMDIWVQIVMLMRENWFLLKSGQTKWPRRVRHFLQ